MKPSKEEIQNEIEKLKELLPVIKPYSLFGDDNKAQLKAQISVLENNWDKNDAFDEYDHSGINEMVLESALDACNWLDGEYDSDTLSEGWETLRTDKTDADVS